MIKPAIPTFFVFLLTGLLGCTQSSNPSEVDKNAVDSVSRPSQIPVPASLNDYWYKGGGAEISSYRLQQARYGEIHEGTAVMVYVTEPFSLESQVKLDDWQNAGEDKVSVLKLNMSKKFLTGIYPYSMMMSTFTPMNNERMIKVTTSAQEWCGHTFLQLNQQELPNYRMRGYSYFETEGDIDLRQRLPMTEDELWTKLRLNPSSLPTGNFSILPGTFYLRLRHQPMEAVPVVAQLADVESSPYWPVPHRTYSINYSNQHSLVIYFESSSPYRIVGWEEKNLSGFGRTEILTTKAKLINTIRSRYWGKNSNEDRALRQSLGLTAE